MALLQGVLHYPLEAYRSAGGRLMLKIKYKGIDYLLPEGPNASVDIDAYEIVEKDLDTANKENQRLREVLEYAKKELEYANYSDNSWRYCNCIEQIKQALQQGGGK